MEASEPVTLLRAPINPVSRTPSARLVGASSKAAQNIATIMPKACNGAGSGVAVEGMKAPQTGEAVRSKGVGRIPGGTSKAKSAAKGLAPAIPATRPKQGGKAGPKQAAAAATTSKGQKAAAGTEAAVSQGDQDQQEAHGCGAKGRFMVIAADLVQFVSPKKLAFRRECIQCNHLAVPKHVFGWYPGIQHGSPLHLQVKVPAAAEAPALGGGTCSLGLGETRTSSAPVEEAPFVHGGGAETPVHTKMVLALVGTMTFAGTNYSFVGPHQILDHFIGWRIVYMQKVRMYLNIV